MAIPVASIILTAARFLAPKLIPSLSGIAEQFARKEITREEMQAKMHEATMEAAADTARANADALAKSFGAFMEATTKSRVLQIGWLLVLISQVWTLFWYQWIVPWGAFMGWWVSYPSPGATVDWAYLLVAACIGAGPLVLQDRINRK